MVGLRGSLHFVFQNFDVGHLSVDQLVHPGLLVAADPDRRVNITRGALFFALWALTALAALRLRNRPLSFLHGVVGLGVALLIFDVSHIFGTVWYYLLLPVWGVTALMAIATVVDRRAPRGQVRASRSPAPARARGCSRARRDDRGVLRSAHGVAPNAQHSDALISDELAAVVPGTVDALNRNVSGATGTSGRYLVSWDDAAYIGSPGYGLLNELDRRCFDVGPSTACG